MQAISTLATSVVLTALIGCASSPAPKPWPTKAGEVSDSFSACAAQSKIPWLVNVVLESEGNTKSMQTLVSSFVGDSQEAQTRALAYLNDLQNRKYSSGEHMAATHFRICLAQKSAQVFTPERTLDCYREQRILFALEVLRFDRGASQEQAVQHLAKANPSDDGSNERMIQRLARDAYTILQPGAESAFSSAQFNVCMTKP